MDDKSIIVRKESNIGWIVFNRPQVMNALDLNGVDEFASALDEMENDETVKVVVLTGAGRAFCAGGDFNFFLKLYSQGSQSVQNFISHVNDIVLKIANMSKFVIASVNGDAMGGGFSFALASDMIIASENARFGLTFIKIGLVPDTGVTYILPRMIGPMRAKELFVTGDIINASEAFRLNIINRVVPADQLEHFTLEVAKKLSHNSLMAMGLTKALVNKSLATGEFQTVLEYETEFQTMCLQGEDSHNLIQNFLDKRGPLAAN